jgi:hypothetical protein
LDAENYEIYTDLKRLGLKLNLSQIYSFLMSVTQRQNPAIDEKTKKITRF